ncbi:MAG: hypothetical protein ACXAC8_18790 [Candidatus Hodarchaeales archaeon]
MSELSQANPDVKEQMIEKLHQDPDKFERMFAAQYLARYFFSESREHLYNAFTKEKDPDVVQSIRKLLDERGKVS